MDALLELITTWFTSLGLVDINMDKLKRQLSVIEAWFRHGNIGVFEGVTAFGKTFVAIIGIHRLNLNYPDATTIVVVPSTKLFKDWQDHIENFKLKNVSVFIVNTYTANYVKTAIKYRCALLVVDEVHRVLSHNGKLFNKTINCTQFDMFLGLTATLDIDERQILMNMKIPIVDTVTMSEARRFNYISEYIVYNLAIPLNTEMRQVYDKYNDTYHATNAKFQYYVDFDKNLALIRACNSANAANCIIGGEWRTGQQWRQWYAEEMGWDGSDDHTWSPKNIAKYAHQWNWAIKERKDFLYNSPDKVTITRQILQKFNVPTITFAETIHFVEALVFELRHYNIKAMPYHSKLKTVSVYEKKRVYKSARAAKVFRQRTNGIYLFDEEEGKYAVEYEKEIKITGSKLKQKIINDFEDGKFNVLCTAKALDEGFDVEGIELGIICSATSKARSSIQRSGRTLRFKPNKTARIINLYHPDTQDEAWLNRRQKGETMIRKINSIDEIV